MKESVGYMIRLSCQMGIYSSIKPSPSLSTHLRAYSLQEKSSEGSSGDGTTDLDMGSSTSELRRRRRVGSSTGGSSSARGASSATHDRLGRLSRVSSASRVLDRDRSRVRSRAGDGVGGGRRGGVVGEERGDGHGHDGGARLLSDGGRGGVVGRRDGGESGNGGEELHFDWFGWFEGC